MGEIPDVIRRAIEAQGKADPDVIASAAPDAIPSDEEAWRIETGRMPEMAEPEVEKNSTPEPEAEQLDLGVQDVPHARNTDPDTSRAAGYAIEDEEGGTSLIRPGTAKHHALRQFGFGTATALEVERATAHKGIWKRVSDLKNAGLVEDTGLRRSDPDTGREGIVWAITSLGTLTLNTLESGREVRL